jgi:hypothetical protein
VAIALSGFETLKKLKDNRRPWNAESLETAVERELPPTRRRPAAGSKLAVATPR